MTMIKHTSNVLSNKAVVDRFVNLMTDKQTIEDDIKQLAEDAKEQGLDGPALKKLAQMTVKKSLKTARQNYKRLRDAARSIGEDQLDLDIDDRPLK